MLIVILSIALSCCIGITVGLIAGFWVCADYASGLAIERLRQVLREERMRSKPEGQTEWDAYPRSAPKMPWVGDDRTFNVIRTPGTSEGDGM